MNPIHKEKYILSREAFGSFTLDQHKEELDKKKRGIKMTAWVQIVVGVLFVAVTAYNGDLGDMFVFTVMAVFMAGAGVHGLLVKYPKYGKQIEENLEKSYVGKGFDSNHIDVKFFEDRLKYSSGENINEIGYTDFYKFFEKEDYFGIHFVTGELILFNPDCNIEKIKQIISDYRRKGVEAEAAEKAEEAATEEMMDTAVEETAAEILE